MHHLIVALAWAVVGLAASGVFAVAAKQQIKEAIQYTAVNFAAAQVTMTHQLQAAAAAAAGLPALQRLESGVLRAWLEQPANEEALRICLQSMDADIRDRLARMLQ